MTKLLELLAEGRAYSVEDLAAALDATPQDVKRQMEFLERTRRKYAGHVGGHNAPNLKFKRKLR